MSNFLPHAPAHRGRAAFTLIELMVSSAIAVIVVGGAMAAFIEGMRIWQQEAIIGELHNNLEISMEKIRRDMRLSSVGIGLMSFFPTNSTDYTTISMPLSQDTDGDGLLDRDPATDKIKWTHTVVYHVKPGSPDQLLRIVFSPRWTNSTPASIYNQLALIVKGSATNCQPGETATTNVLFSNLVQLKFRPPESSFDCYSSGVRKDVAFDWGSVVLDSGTHDLTFKVTGKNASSSGYNFELDRFALSWSGSWREGEVYLPVLGHPPGSPCYNLVISNGTVSAIERDNSGWSGGSALLFRGLGVGASITFKVQNDLWNDNNFMSPGGVLSSNVSAKYDSYFQWVSPFVSEMAVTLDRGTAWTANSCGAETSYSFVDPVSVRAFVYGGTNQPDMTIVRNGSSVRATFQKPAGTGVKIKNVMIVDPTTGTSGALLFSGAAEISLPPGSSSSVVTDWLLNWDISAAQNYELLYDLDTFAAGATNGVSAWQNAAGITLSQVGPLGGPLVATNLLPCFAQLEVGYPTMGRYRSGIYDTQLPSPTYRFLRWTQIQRIPSGDVDIRIRSGNAPDLSDVDETAWTVARAANSGYFQGGTAESLASLPKKRYIQYEALLQCDYDFTTGTKDTAPWAHTASYGTTPVVPDVALRDVTVEWDGPPGLVDLITDITKRPDGPTISASVDGKSLVKGVSVQLEIFKKSRQRLESVSGVMEITPLNTGR